MLAFRYADASVLAPFSYTQLVVSFLGFLLFGEVPDVWTVTGAAFIVASGLYTAHRERVRRSQLGGFGRALAERLSCRVGREEMAERPAVRAPSSKASSPMRTNVILARYRARAAAVSAAKGV